MYDCDYMCVHEGVCIPGDVRLSGPLPGQVKMLLEENAALQACTFLHLPVVSMAPLHKCHAHIKD